VRKLPVKEQNNVETSGMDQERTLLWISHATSHLSRVWSKRVRYKPFNFKTHMLKNASKQ
jgi:hypothetical protein